MTDAAEQILLHIKYLNDEAAAQPPLNGIVSGASLRVVARESADGRVRVSGSVSHRIHRRRASGKTFRYWDRKVAISLARTKQDLVVFRTLSTRPKRATTLHLFDDDGPSVIKALVAGLQHDLLLPSRGIASELRYVERPAHREVEVALVDLGDEVNRRIGDLPSVSERFPLLTSANRFALALYGHSFFLDAHDYRRVSENVFGKTRYRKPLAREIERLTGAASAQDCGDDFRILHWFRLFRGLVPIDWIIESMRATPAAISVTFKADELVEARRLLRRVPKPILRRILAEPTQQAMRIIQDTAREIGTPELRRRDLDLLPGLIAARGQKRIRGAQDLEALVRSMPRAQLMSASYGRSCRAVEAVIRESVEVQEMNHYNELAQHLDDVPTATWAQWQDPEFRNDAAWLLADYRRELMDAQALEAAEQEEQRRQQRLARDARRAAWATATAQRIDGLTVCDMKIIVARDANTLACWGATLNNCIGTYANRLGLDVLAAVVDGDGQVRLNVQIEHGHGITQFLGTNNRSAITEMGKQAQTVLDALVDAGVSLAAHALGVEGLADTTTVIT
ncbi:hypothetical protein ACGFJT_37035 [Actinomadura geliboluensis]|uniref:hypothetical protein n=1 Tax=Actinomadura geliboluensis TaxID=882440 RepID=UPI00371E8737